MFTYVKLKNFMSLKDVVFDFRKNSKEIKKFVSIYGENGSGKSNFVNCIDFLCKSIKSFRMKGELETLTELVQKENIPQELIEMVLNSVNILKYIEKSRMIECDEDTSVEYGFKIGKHEGLYVVSFNERFVYEKLYYFTGKQRGVIFEIQQDSENININFSNKLFSNKKIEVELEDQIMKYWGKHTFLSILQNERDEKNESFIKDNYLPYLIEVLDMLQDVSVHLKNTSRTGSVIYTGKPYNVLENLSNGRIQQNERELLDCSERIIKDFFTQAYADIKDVYYERTYENEEISYKLYVKKMIGGKIRIIDFKRESAGTQHILEIIRSLLGAFCGVTVVFDEIDDGIHDLLLKIVLTSMIDDINGQLIITTHNTCILEEIDIRSAYIINVDYLGNKEVKCLDQFPRIQGSNNPRRMYLKGLFGGVPFVDVLNYDEIINELYNHIANKGGV